MNAPRHRLETLISDLVAEGLFATGIQLYVSLQGRPIFDLAVGTDGAGAPIDGDTLFATYCATKPLVALAIARLMACGELSIDDSLGDLLPDPLHADLRQVQLAAILTHTAGLDSRNRISAAMTPAAGQRQRARNQRLCRPSLSGGSAYSELLGWTLLGEVIETVTGEPLGTFLRREVRSSMGIADDVALLMSDDEYDHLSPRFGLNCILKNRQSFPLLGEITRRTATAWNPAYGGYASARGLGRLYEQIATRLRDRIDPRLPADVLSEFVTTRHVSTWDDVLGRPCSYGLGFMTDLSSHYFAPQCSSASFGHAGNLGISAGLADPALGLAVGVHFNAIIDAESSIMYRRRAVCEAVYELANSESQSFALGRESSASGHRRGR